MPGATDDGEEGYCSAPEWSSRGAIIANVAAHVVAATPAALYRLIVPSIIAEYEVTPVEIGYMFSLSAVCTGTCAIFVGINARRMNFKWACALAMVVHVIGAFICLFAPNFAAFLVGRVVSASADGLLICAANAALARSSKPTRNWTYCAVAVGLAGAAGNALVGRLIPVYGMDALFVLLAVVSLVMLPSQLLIPGLRPPPVNGREAVMAAPFKAISNALRGRRGMLLMGMIVVFTTGSAMLSPFEAVIGRNIGLSIAQIGDIRGIAFAAATCALFVGLFLGSRIGATIPFVITGFAVALSDGAIGLATVPLAFGVAVVVSDAAHRLNGPYYASILARHDRTGGLNGAAIAFINVGSAIGPTIGGYVHQATGGYQAVGLGAMTIGLVGFGVMALVSARMEREEERGAATANS